MSVTGQGRSAQRLARGKELRDSGRAGFDQLFNGGINGVANGRPSSLERFTVVRPVEPTKSRANGVLAGRKAALIVARMCTRRRAPWNQGELALCPVVPSGLRPSRVCSRW